MSNMFKTALLLVVLTVLLVLIGGAIGGQQGMLVAFVLALGMNFFSYWFSDKMVLAMYRARPIEESQAPALYRIVRTLATRGGIPMPRVYLIPSETPNAFATGRNPQHAAVAVTEGSMRILDEEELGGVLGGILMVILAPIAAMLIQMAVSRAREFQADATGARLAGKPWGLAKALEKLDTASKALPMDASHSTAHLFIVNPLSGRSLLRLFSTHPPIEERIARLRSMRV